MLQVVYRKCDNCGELEGFSPYNTHFQNESTLCTKCKNACEHKSVIKAFEGMIKTRGLDAMGKAGMHIAWNRSSVTNKKRKNILVSTVADKGVMTLMVQIYCSGCMRWVQIPFYSPKKLLNDEKLRGRADSNGEY